MLETSARLLRLLTLLQTRRFWSGQELSERLEITPRTVRRDVERLKRLGYPVEGTPGVAGGYQMGAGASLPPLQLDDEEALAISLGLFALTNGSVEGVEEASLRALVKLERVLPAHLRKRAALLRTTLQPLDRSGPRVNSVLLTTLADAVSEHRSISFCYENKQRQSSERSVEPAGIVHTGQRWYLVAWDHSRKDWRTFRADRIQGTVELGQRYAPRPLPDDGDLRSYVHRSVNVQPYGVEVRVLAHTSLSRIATRVGPHAATLEAVGAERCRMIVRATSLNNVAAWLLYLDLDFEVEGPDELREQLCHLCGRIERATGKAGKKIHPR
jgi:predicted DNA-binding transcriptional regulator YafY